jgi:hypothetical protein
MHWGYFSKLLKPLIELDSGDYVTIEALTHHAYDDYERMIKGDPGAESVFLWTKDKKSVNRRGAGPIDASIPGRGAGEGFGVHICTASRLRTCPGVLYPLELAEMAREGDLLLVGDVLVAKDRPWPRRRLGWCDARRAPRCDRSGARDASSTDCPT